MHRQAKTKALYITYMGLSEPLIYSQALNYLKAIARRDIGISILSFEKKEFLNKGKILEIKNDLQTSGIQWFFLRYHKKPQFISKPYDVIVGTFFIMCIAIRNKIDIIHARGTFCALMGLMSCLFLRKKMIFDMRGLMAEEYADAGSWKRSSFIYNFINCLERYFIRNADEVVMLNKKTQEIVLKKDKVKSMTIIPTCVDLERFNFVTDKGKYEKHKYSQNGKSVLIYTGSLGTWYMLSEMMDFYRELLNSGFDGLFLILSQTDKGWIEKNIPDDLRKYVIIDFSDPRRVADFLNSADIAIFFIKPCLSKTASCPTKFGEYLACGLPVIINGGIGDTEEIVRREKVGVVINDFNIQEYKRSVMELKELLKEGDVLQKRCRSAAEKYFSLKDGSEKYALIYTRLTQKMS